ncbi:hypothetical protein F3Y22_tig00111741pilonHSYRG00008 [Hibiscus syriacus]|uniref:Uncharacterized protein n=1 Tax=Hibiscus syriacus TaxID=106335 RepID=A0A6A2XGK6_HIBSY|nr:hypothetical protein F3Y22_tig00111741pilonHSYRG00008 [Hibiscus syriacus]
MDDPITIDCTDEDSALQVPVPEPTRGYSSAVTAAEATVQALQSSLLGLYGGGQETAQGLLLDVRKESLQGR